jgi:hypothetical protein
MAVTVHRYRQSCKKVKQQIAGWFCETTLQDLIDKNVHVPTFLVFLLFPSAKKAGMPVKEASRVRHISDVL